VRAAVAEGRGRADRWGQAVSGGDARVGACAGVNGDRQVGHGAWAERAIWACWAAAVGEELGPRGVQLGQGFGLGFPGKVGLGLG